MRSFLLVLLVLGIPEAVQAQSEAPPPTAPEPVAAPMPADAAAVPLEAPKAAAPAVAEQGREVTGEVLEILEGEVVLSGKGWRPGDTVDFVRMRAAGDDGVDHGFDIVGHGQLRAARADRARAVVPMNTRLEKGTLARLSSERYSTYAIAPARLGGLFSVGADARPYLPVGAPVGFGAQASVWAAYRFTVPIAIRANISPVGFVTSSRGGGTGAGVLMLTLDTRFFEVGLGVGGMSVAPSWTNDRKGAVVLSQTLRIGATDGLMLQAQNDVYATDQWQFGNLVGTGQIPLTQGWWLLLRGGGGNAGFWFAEGGARHMLLGNGDHGTVFLNALVGAAGVMANVNNGSYGSWYTMVNGPAVCVGFEWRP